MKLEKQIIAIWGLESMGKSAVIWAIFNKLNINNTFEVLKVLKGKGDIRALGSYNGKLIGIDGQGDPSSKQGRSIEDFAKNEKCDIIICASRTKGETVRNIENISEKFGYEMIWTSNFCGRYKINGKIESNNGKMSNNGLDLNDAFSDAIINLITRL